MEFRRHSLFISAVIDILLALKQDEDFYGATRWIAQSLRQVPVSLSGLTAPALRRLKRHVLPLKH